MKAQYDLLSKYGYRELEKLQVEPDEVNFAKRIVDDFRIASKWVGNLSYLIEYHRALIFERVKFQHYFNQSTGIPHRNEMIRLRNKIKKIAGEDMPISVQKVTFQIKAVGISTNINIFTWGVEKLIDQYVLGFNGIATAGKRKDERSLAIESMFPMAKFLVGEKVLSKEDSYKFIGELASEFGYSFTSDDSYPESKRVLKKMFGSNRPAK